MTTAFVLSGGASLGSIHVGMLRALEEDGIRPDLIVGTSVGAVNGGWLASGGSADELARIWHGLRRADLFPLRPLLGLQAFLGRADHFVPNGGLGRLLRRNLGFTRLEDSSIPLTVIATELSTGDEVALSRGPAVDAILASAALPGVFPPVTVEGRTLFDGGIVNNTPITQAIDAGATEVWVISTGYSCAVVRPPKGAIAMGLHAVALLVQQRFVLETAARDYPVTVNLIPSPCPITAGPTDFSQTDELMERAYVGTRQWLDHGRPQVQPFGVHQHDSAGAGGGTP